MSLFEAGGRVRSVTADGAYNGAPVYAAIRDARPKHSPPKIVVPPPRNSIPPPGQAHRGTMREYHAAEIAAHGRMAWQKKHGYGRRPLVETTISRIKRLSNDGHLSARFLWHSVSGDRSGHCRSEQDDPRYQARHRESGMKNEQGGTNSARTSIHVPKPSLEFHSRAWLLTNESPRWTAGAVQTMLTYPAKRGGLPLTLDRRYVADDR